MYCSPDRAQDGEDTKPCFYSFMYKSDGDKEGDNLAANKAKVDTTFRPTDEDKKKGGI